MSASTLVEATYRAQVRREAINAAVERWRIDTATEDEIEAMAREVKP